MDNPFLLPVPACKQEKKIVPIVSIFFKTSASKEHKQGKKLSLLSLLSLKPPQAKVVLEEGEHKQGAQARKKLSLLFLLSSAFASSSAFY